LSTAEHCNRGGVRDGALGARALSSNEHLERVFGRFERANDRTYESGLGLGLYVARMIVNAHGGSIRASNREGGGAELEIDLPSTGIAG
jgi:K+-sensing histidine kinase KdpD